MAIQAACVALALAFFLPMAVRCDGKVGALRCEKTLDRNGQTDDGRLFAMLWDASRRALVDYGEWPSWNPYHCGGRALYADPQAPFPGPIFLLTFLWLPSLVGLKLWVLAHLIFGALGARLLARDRGANAPEQVLTAALTCACGFLAEHLGGGHLSFTPLLFLPWILLAQRRSLADARWTVLGAGLLALTVIEGGPVPLPLMLAVLGLDALARLGSPRDRRGLLVSLPLLALLFFLLSAVRLLPVLAMLSLDPRLTPLDDQLTFAELVRALLAGRQPAFVPGHPYVWAEYNDYLGPLPVLLLAAGLLLAIVQRAPGDAARAAERRERRIDAFVFLGLAWLALGNIPGLSLFALLHRLPIYDSLRVPSRFLYPATAVGALLAVSALRELRRFLSERAGRGGLLRAFIVAEGALALCVAVDLCRTNGPRLQQGVDPPLPDGPPTGAFFQDPARHYDALATHPSRRAGTPQCYVSFELLPPPGLWFGAGPQERLEPPEAGTAALTHWSPSTLAFRISLRAPATLVVNQAADPGWRASRGERTQRDDRLLAVALPEGEHLLVLRHRPPSLFVGLFLSALGVLGAALVVRRFTPAAQAALLAPRGRTAAR